MTSNLLVARRAWRVCAAAASLLAPLCTQAQTAPAWPEKTVRIIAAGPAGGSADIVARLLADALSKQTGQTVIAEPKPGAGGILAVNELSLAPRDGHTLLVGVNSLVSEIPHIVKQAANMGAEIKPLAEVARGGLVMVGNLALPAKTLPEVIAYTKAKTQARSTSPRTPQARSRTCSGCS